MSLNGTVGLHLPSSLFFSFSLVVPMRMKFLSEIPLRWAAFLENIKIS